MYLLSEIYYTFFFTNLLDLYNRTMSYTFNTNRFLIYLSLLTQRLLIQSTNLLSYKNQNIYQIVIFYYLIYILYFSITKTSYNLIIFLNIYHVNQTYTNISYECLLTYLFYYSEVFVTHHLPCITQVYEPELHH